MHLIPRPFVSLFLGLFGAFTLFGISMTIVGAALPRILADFGWNYSAAGAVIAAGAATYFLGSLSAGNILKKLGPKALAVIGLSACVVGLALFASSPSFLLNLLFNAFIGAGQGLLEPTVNWSTLRMDKEGSGRPMSLMHGAFAIGAVAGPVILGLIISTALPWTILFRAIAVLFALLAVALAAMPFDRLGRVEPEAEIGQRKTSAVKRTASYWLGFLCLLLYVGAEMGVSNWIAEYFVRIFAAGPALASFTVSLFWMGLLAGRFGVPTLYRGGRQELVLVVASFLLVVATTALCILGFTASSGNPLWFPFVLTFLAGLGCSIVYPTVVSIVGISCEEDQAGAVALAVSGGGIGLFAFPFLMSWISQAYGIRIGFTSYAIIAIFTAAACTLLAKTFARRRRRVWSGSEITRET
jgi:fucose permease